MIIKHTLIRLVFHQKLRRIYIFGGQRQRMVQRCPEFLWYDIETGITQSMPMPATVDKPPVGYTQRATIDTDNDEIYILSVSIIIFFLYLILIIIVLLIFM